MLRSFAKLQPEFQFFGRQRTSTLPVTTPLYGLLGGKSKMIQIPTAVGPCGNGTLTYTCCTEKQSTTRSNHALGEDGSPLVMTHGPRCCATFARTAWRGCGTQLVLNG